MATLDLTKYGITGSTVIAHNPSYEVLFAEETKAGLEGYEVGQNTAQRCKCDDWYLHRSLSQGQVHRDGSELKGHRMVDF